MQINIVQSSDSFKGGFRFKNMSQEAKESLPNIINRGKVIFEDFEKKGDVFLVTRDSQEEAVFTFIKDKKLNFDFYPSINTNLMVHNQPQKLSRILTEINEMPIKTIKEAREAIKKRAGRKVQEEAPEHITNILRTLCIDNVNPIENCKGAHRIVDKEFERTIYISRPSSFGMYYVKVQPKNKNNQTDRYMLDEKGNKLAKFNTPDSILVFESRFKNLFK